MEIKDSLSWNTSEPQFYRDSWRNSIRRLDYTGRCVICNRRTYAFEDGENDPRGIIGDRAGSPLYASDYEKQGPSIPVCFLCSNDEPSYRRALALANGFWSDKAASNG
jgi:hypothetical protein